MDISAIMVTFAQNGDHVSWRVKLLTRNIQLRIARKESNHYSLSVAHVVWLRRTANGWQSNLGQIGIHNRHKGVPLLTQVCFEISGCSYSVGEWGIAREPISLLGALLTDITNYLGGVGTRQLVDMG